MLTIVFDDGGTERSLEIMAESLAELRPVFALFTKWMRGEIDQVFASQGEGRWPGPSQATEERAAARAAAKVAKIRETRLDSLRGRLRSEKRRAERRLARVPLLQQITSSKLSERRRASVARYEAQQAALEQYAKTGTHAPGQKKLSERIERREARAAAKIAAVEQGQQLGRFPGSIQAEAGRNGWEMYSAIPWSGVQNEGGEVGNGATLPARTFLEWTPERLKKFVELAQKYVLERAERAERSRAK